MKRPKSKYYEQLYAKKLDNLDKMDKFLDSHIYQNWFKKTEKLYAEKLFGPIMCKEIELVIKKLHTKKRSGLDGEFAREFYQMFKEELTPVFHRLFQKIEGEGTFSNSSL